MVTNSFLNLSNATIIVNMSSNKSIGAIGSELTNTSTQYLYNITVDGII